MPNLGLCCWKPALPAVKSLPHGGTGRCELLRSGSKVPWAGFRHMAVLPWAGSVTVAPGAPRSGRSRLGTRWPRSCTSSSIAQSNLRHHIQEEMGGTRGPRHHHAFAGWRVISRHLHRCVLTTEETICSQLLGKTIAGFSCDCWISDGEVRWRRGEGAKRKEVELKKKTLNVLMFKRWFWGQPRTLVILHQQWLIMIQCRWDIKEQQGKKGKQHRSK